MDFDFGSEKKNTDFDFKAEKKEEVKTDFDFGGEKKEVVNTDFDFGEKKEQSKEEKLIDFDFEKPAVLNEIVNTPQGEFDFENTGMTERKVVPETDLIENSSKPTTIDDMLTVEARKSEQEKSDKIQDFLNKQFTGIKLAAQTSATKPENETKIQIGAAVGDNKQKEAVNFDFNFSTEQVKTTQAAAFQFEF